MTSNQNSESNNKKVVFYSRVSSPHAKIDDQLEWVSQQIGSIDLPLNSWKRTVVYRRISHKP